MGDKHRPDPVTAASAIVADRFGTCRAAFLAGSVTGGRATPYSDLDLVIITDDPEAPYRESFTDRGWPVETFVHTMESARRYFASDAQSRRPVLPRMVLDGTVLRDVDGTVASVRAEARRVIDAGPAPLTDAQLEERRYFVTDLLEDLRGMDADSGLERWLVASDLVSQAANLILATCGEWTGTGKWLARLLSEHAPIRAHQLDEAMRALAATGRQDALISVIQAILDASGGPVFAGFKRAGRRDPEA